MFVFVFVFEKKIHRICISIWKIRKLVFVFVFVFEKTYLNPALKRAGQRHSTVTELLWFPHMCNICAIGSVSNTIPRCQSLDIRRDYYTSTLMYKCIDEAAPIRLINELVMTADVPSYPNRAVAQWDVHVPKPNNELYRQSFKYRSAISWNVLPHDIKNAPNIDEFKYLYKKHCFDKTLWLYL